MTEKKAKEVVKAYIMAREKARVEQSVLLAKEVTPIFNTMLGSINSVELKCVLNSINYDKIRDLPLEEFKVNENGDVILGYGEHDLFRYIDVVRHNLNLMKNRAENEGTRLPNKFNLVETYMEEIYEKFKECIMTDCLQFGEVKFKNRLKDYNKYIHGLFDVVRLCLIDELRYTLATKDDLYIRNYMGVINEWLKNKYYHDLDNEIIVTSSGCVLDIKYLTRIGELEKWIIDINDVMFGCHRVKGKHSLCTVIKTNK